MPRHDHDEPVSLTLVCDYCSNGDLYTPWLLKNHFEEDDVRLFAAELGSALGFLHDLGVIHRDVKMENVLLSDRAPEVLGGTPYSHAADWWSLGITLFSLASGKFPVAPEPDHSTMLKKVRECPYVIPETLSSAIGLLLSELLCKSPAARLRDLDRFKSQSFFRRASFDPETLQKSPVESILRLRGHPERAARAMRGLSPDYFRSFDCDRLLRPPAGPSDSSPALVDAGVSQAATELCSA